MSQIIEIAFDISSSENYEFLDQLLAILCKADVLNGYYVEPRNRFVSLEDCEAQCEGK